MHLPSLYDTAQSPWPFKVVEVGMDASIPGYFNVQTCAHATAL
jgi:hypothetical protein